MPPFYLASEQAASKRSLTYTFKWDLGEVNCEVEELVLIIWTEKARFDSEMVRKWSKSKAQKGFRLRPIADLVLV